MIKESKIVEFFKNNKIFLHIFLGAILFYCSTLIIDYESLGFFGAFLINLIAGFCLGGFVEWIQGNFSGKNSTNKLILFLDRLHIIRNKSKTKFSRFDCVMTAIGYTVLGSIWILFVV